MAIAVVVVCAYALIAWLVAYPALRRQLDTTLQEIRTMGPVAEGDQHLVSSVEEIAGTLEVSREDVHRRIVFWGAVFWLPALLHAAPSRVADAATFIWYRLLAAWAAMLGRNVIWNSPDDQFALSMGEGAVAAGGLIEIAAGVSGVLVDVRGCSLRVTSGPPLLKVTKNDEGGITVHLRGAYVRRVYPADLLPPPAWPITEEG